MKAVAILLSMLVTTSVFSSSGNECYLKLTVDHYSNSTHFYREALETDRDYGRDYQGYSYFIIRDILSELGCKRSSINFGKGPRGKSATRCMKAINGVISSLSCYVESNIGYFFITWDQLDNANIIYNRWD